MGLLMIILLSFCYISFGPKYSSADTFDVTSYGAIGDGDTDDTDAFVRAWADVCGDNSKDPTLVIPSDRMFLLRCVAFSGPCSSDSIHIQHPRVRSLLRCVAFSGPCSSDSIHIQLLGGITAPKSKDGWQGCDTNGKGYLIIFANVQGLTVDGPGQIDGQGSVWWGGSEGSYKPTGATCDCPSMLHFHKCDGLHLRDTTYINSPKCHISINGCHGVDVGNVHISAPEHSPNTDGFDISESSNVNIHDSVIESGDDCVAINSGTYNISVIGVACGPGHGISIGSLGKNGGYATVEQVLVQNCNITGTTNGVRIKTIPDATGYARGIVFQDIQLDNVKNPIIIDQHYCSNMENAECPAPPDAPAVKVSDVNYTNIHGSSASKKAINLNCSGKYKCTGIVTNQVGITGDDVVAFCNNVEGEFIDTSPSISCN